MGVSYKQCSRCGQAIRLTRMRYGQWVPMDTDGSGKHICVPSWLTSSRSESSPITSPRSWRLETLAHPLTYGIRCWWCGDRVFFHTNGNGDCVLFDSLGWPWAIHPCWEAHRDQSERRRKLSQLEGVLELARYNGNRFESFDIPETTPDMIAKTQENIRQHQVDPQSDESFDIPEMTPESIAKMQENIRLHDPHYVCLLGYVSRVTDTTFDLSIDESSGSWSLIHVDSTELTLKFLVPEELLDGLPEYSLIRIAGRRCTIGKNPYMIATRVEWLTRLGGESFRMRLARIGRKYRCRYCGRDMWNVKRWGINEAFLPECGECYDFRDGRDPKEFEQLCCRLLHHRGRRRWVGGGSSVDLEESSDEEKSFEDSNEETRA
jgi:DNA-directed RNA polymerase subunit RPC12/RpoP